MACGENTLFHSHGNLSLLSSRIPSSHFFTVSLHNGTIRKNLKYSPSIVQLKIMICWAFARKQHVLSVFSDLKKPYDTIWRHCILRTLHSIGMCRNISLFICSFLQDRTFRVSFYFLKKRETAGYWSQLHSVWHGY